ncbi:MAG: hypothetical protein BGN89_15295 [Alphaproteobacteria bacterium 64-6]|uniref:DUF1127 domain-containing protein n=1 Tax=Hyphomicrobium sp. CS1BSMeth3 TaxID=1892844 RepID=UPI00086BB388|nr:DUF1127 domain-containing protein [Hyphomicrobium sp. CS1BSMeth3]ODT27271.1 MAG: hypothetical protein ABS54_06205 [Hyphomicrobium sp. SCN 65-11]OJU25136.1 MAG: hypothetical protein BGN89_15295 [Alphaproteobacteria bacterium 64-6]
MSTQRIDVGGFVYDPSTGNTSRSTPSSVLAAIGARARLWIAEYIRRRAFRRAERELYMLDDRMLQDIGLCRSEITSAVRNPVQERINGAQPPVAASF